MLKCKDCNLKLHKSCKEFFLQEYNEPCSIAKLSRFHTRTKHISRDQITSLSHDLVSFQRAQTIKPVATNVDEIDIKHIKPDQADWQKVGQGAYGMVYKCIYYGNPVAVKVLIIDEHEDNLDSLKQAFFSEVKILRSFTGLNQHILDYTGYIQKDNFLAVVTQWCNNGSLYDIIHNIQVCKYQYMLLDRVFL